jgi:hypothetical protein
MRAGGISARTLYLSVIAEAQNGGVLTVGREDRRVRNSLLPVEQSNEPLYWVLKLPVQAGVAGVSLSDRSTLIGGP